MAECYVCLLLLVIIILIKALYKEFNCIKCNCYCQNQKVQLQLKEFLKKYYFMSYLLRVKLSLKVLISVV